MTKKITGAVTGTLKIKKMGRPPGNPKNRRIERETIYLSSAEKGALKALGIGHGYEGRADVLRHAFGLLVALRHPSFRNSLQPDIQNISTHTT